MRKFLFLIALPLAIYCQTDELSPQEDLTPEQIEQQLQSAEIEFKKAKKAFNPWYTGPLLTPSPSMMPPRMVNMQPYLFATTNYAQYNKDRHSVDIPNIFQLNSQTIFQTGIASWMDIIFIVQGTESWQSHKNGGSFGDSSITIGFPIHMETLYVPQIKVSLAETFPTGRFNHLSSTHLGLEGLGNGGSYQTKLSLGFGKVIYWTNPHPINSRLVFSYNVPAPVHVSGFNSYGGGFGTFGKVYPGKTFSADLGLEVSINQPWVFALDVVYVSTARTKFKGRPGVTAAGTPASVGGGYSDQLSLAPAIEYNWNSNFGILWGAWFSVYGRNSFNFASGIFSMTWTFLPTNPP